MAPDTRELAGPWQQWIAENKLLGLTDAALIAVLTEAGVDPVQAGEHVTRIACSPAYIAAAKTARRLRRLESHLATMRGLASLASTHGQIERRQDLSRTAFCDDYYCANRPVIITDLVVRWPAYTRWLPAYFKARFGGVPVQITADREADPHYHVNFNAHLQEVPLGELADRIATGAESNDFYLVSNNLNLEREALRPLLADIGPFPDYLDASPEVRAPYLWFGPAGTVTPLHFDPSNILFCQVWGTKRWQLISPLETGLLDASRGFYSEIDAECPDLDRFPAFGDVAVTTFDLHAGEALFLPVGWWHHVRALTPSISVSMTNFLQPNQFEGIFEAMRT